MNLLAFLAGIAALFITRQIIPLILPLVHLAGQPWGVVLARAVFVAAVGLGFAAWENLGYLARHPLDFAALGVACIFLACSGMFFRRFHLRLRNKPL